MKKADAQGTIVNPASTHRAHAGPALLMAGEALEQRDYDGRHPDRHFDVVLHGRRNFPNTGGCATRAQIPVRGRVGI
jgi:hypothetical protein